MSTIPLKNTLYFANDHAGVELKTALMAHGLSLGYDVIDLGTNTKDSVDYPDYAKSVALKLKQDVDGIGILICGTGIGMSISANRHPWIRAALCSKNLKITKLARAHNHANVLCLGARFIDVAPAKKTLETFLTTPFEDGRHEKRVRKMC
ncbi:MAG: ribose 5-phosphate isomerase B [Alphaproteobacteria bacterium]|nr:ribose 5-phosphate isomerase B [Alphaproteobacteria bacterium]